MQFERESKSAAHGIEKCKLKAQSADDFLNHARTRAITALERFEKHLRIFDALAGTAEIRSLLTPSRNHYFVSSGILSKFMS